VTTVRPPTTVVPPTTTCAPEHSEHCITCADDGVPMTVLRVNERAGLALCVDEGGARSTVETALIEPVAPGEVLLVHAGTAIVALGPALSGQVAR
jgi:hydrogenase maturation factor